MCTECLIRVRARSDAARCAWQREVKRRQPEVHRSSPGHLAVTPSTRLDYVESLLIRLFHVPIAGSCFERNHDLLLLSLVRAPAFIRERLRLNDGSRIKRAEQPRARRRAPGRGAERARWCRSQHAPRAAARRRERARRRSGGRAQLQRGRRRGPDQARRAGAGGRGAAAAGGRAPRARCAGPHRRPHPRCARPARARERAVLGALLSSSTSTGFACPLALCNRAAGPEHPPKTHPTPRHPLTHLPTSRHLSKTLTPRPLIPQACQRSLMLRASTGTPALRASQVSGHPAAARQLPQL